MRLREGELVIMYLVTLFFLFKQKTAYEMRISDWSSDVCSSDLTAIDTTAAGIEVAKVRPTLSPRYTFAAVNSMVMRPPSRIARSVSSPPLRRAWFAGSFALTDGISRSGGLAIRSPRYAYAVPCREPGLTAFPSGKPASEHRQETGRKCCDHGVK